MLFRSLMDAAQSISDKEYSWHHTKEECEAALTCGYPYGFGVNLTVFTGAATENAAQHALENWISSPGHFETMIDPDVYKRQLYGTLCRCAGVRALP